MAAEKWHYTEVQDMFVLFNSRYFNNRLPPCKVSFASHAFTGGLGLFRPRAFEQEGVAGVSAYKYYIFISNRIKWSGCLFSFTLLHEMVHLDIHAQMVKSGEIHKWDRQTGHGPQFQRGMKRLANMGAFAGLW